METPSKPPRKVSYRSLEARREWKAEAAMAARRRELAGRYPDINPQAWSNLGAEGYGSMTGAGARALREWLRSLAALAFDIGSTCRVKQNDAGSRERGYRLSGLIPMALSDDRNEASIGTSPVEDAD